MKITIEFCRIRNRNDIHAILKRIWCDAVNHAEAVAKAHAFAGAADMLQTPDLFRVLDDQGEEIVHAKFSKCRKATWREVDPDSPRRR